MGRRVKNSGKTVEVIYGQQRTFRQQEEAAHIFEKRCFLTRNHNHYKDFTIIYKDYKVFLQRTSRRFCDIQFPYLKNNEKLLDQTRQHLFWTIAELNQNLRLINQKRLNTSRFLNVRFQALGRPQFVFVCCANKL